jgi:hypothetical protein
MQKENLLLSADGDISLYQADKEILDNFDDLIKEFCEWNTSNCFDETLFVQFLKNKFGEKSIEFVKIAGVYAEKFNKRGGIEYDIEKEYPGTRWYNF